MRGQILRQNAILLFFNSEHIPMQLMSALSDSALIISESDHENEVFKLTLDKDYAIAQTNFKLFFIKGVTGKGRPDAMVCEKAAALYQQVGKLGHCRRSVQRSLALPRRLRRDRFTRPSGAG